MSYLALIPIKWRSPAGGNWTYQEMLRRHWVGRQWEQPRARIILACAQGIDPRPFVWTATADMIFAKVTNTL
jgi:hypothetical protein